MQSITVKAPGRINLIGEHTDYNNGFVLPAAIQKAATVTIEKRTDNLVVLTALDLNESITISLVDMKPSSIQWANYMIGVIAQIQKKHNFPIGFSITLKSDIPIGAGLSSSAAIECAVAYALNELFAFGIDKMELALMAQKAEQEYAGVQCGIMDQFASLFGKKDQVVLLDCKTMEYQYFPLELKEYSIVLFDTQIKHALASSEYNTRRLECEAGVAMIQSKYAQVNSLRDANLHMLNECVNASLYPIVYNRCKYVIQEIERTIGATQNLAANDLKCFGEKMFATHEGLSKLYEVSCPELDLLVDAVKNKEGAVGARMMGGGFGGCTINIVKTNAVNDLIKEVEIAYQVNTGKALLHYIVSIEDGANEITNSKF
jgi:galactokinase